MPTVAAFDGIKIELYFDEHPPPHFHARYAGHIAQIEIGTLTIRRGSLPLPQYRKVMEWAEPRRSALLTAWKQCDNGVVPERIP